MKKVGFALTILAVLAGPVFSRADPPSALQSVPPLGSLSVPDGNGKPVLLDGLFSPGEWDDALKVPVHERVELLLKKNSGHLFLGLKFKDALGVIVDLWLTSDDETAYQMHSSGQLGEGTLTLPAADEWPGTRIGYTKDWDANEIKSDSQKKAAWQAAGRPAEGYRETLFPSDGKEFQILLAKFAARRLKMRFRAGDREGLIVYPEGTDLKSASGWQEIVLPEGGQAGDEEEEKREIAQAPADQTAADLPLHTERFSDRVLFAWACDNMQMIRTVALSTARGVVVIEASLLRSIDSRIRRVIEMEFGRQDIKYLINTHFHHDHTAGNQVYADATIVGHRTVPEGMRSELTGEGLAKQIEKFKGMQKDWGERQKKAAPDSRDFHFYREGLVLLRTVLEELQTGFQPTFPTVLFEKNLILDMGDMTVELYAVGGTHTPSDIMIFVPEEGLVAVGDMWPDQVLPYLRKGGPWDLGLILENWGRIVESGREIKHVNIAHSDMWLEVETFKQQYRYLRTLWNGLRELKAAGATLEEAKAKYTAERDFPYFKDRMLKMRDTDIHQNNVEAIWEKIKGE